MNDENSELRIALTHEQLRKYEADRLGDIDLLAKYAAGFQSYLADAPPPAQGGLGAVIPLLKDEVASFGVPEVVPLAHTDPATGGLRPSATPAADPTKYDYYAVTFPVTLFPKLDWQFDRLECQIELSPGAGESRPAIAFDIYPADEWDTIAKIGMEVNVGIDEAFQFRGQLPEGAPVLSGEASARTNASLRFVVPPRNYSLQRATVLSRGRGNSEVFWRLLGANYFRRDEPRFGIVLQVPKGVAAVTARGSLAAYRTSLFWSAALGSLLDDLPARIKSWLRRGSPLYGQASWPLVTRG
jgi:hypothetical protein